MTRTARGVLVALALCAGAGESVAQQPSAGAAAPPANAVPVVAPDSTARYALPGGAQLRPATSVYQLSLVRNGVTTPLGIRTVQVSDAAVGGVAGWLIAESRSGSAVPTTDSLWLSRSDLSPERWAATIDRTQLGVSFSRDSAFGAVQSYRGRASFASAVPLGALVTGGMAERVIELLPLRDGYRAGTSMLLVDLGTPRVLDAEIAVERSERTPVGNGEVDCWVVVLRAGALEERLWVTRDTPRVVRTEQTMQGGVLLGVVQ